MWNIAQTATCTLVACISLISGSTGPFESMQPEMDPRQIIVLAINAQGGREKLEGLQRSYYKAEFRAKDVSGSIEEWRDLPNRRKQIVQSKRDHKSTVLIRVTAEKVEWEKTDDMETKDRGEAEFRKSRKHLESTLSSFLFPLLNEKKYSLVYRGQLMIGDRQTDCVRVISGERSNYDLFFDSRNSLLVKQSEKDPSPQLQGKTADSYLDDYKSFDGVLLPTRTTVKVDGETVIGIELVLKQAKIMRASAQAPICS